MSSTELQLTCLYKLIKNKEALHNNMCSLVTYKFTCTVLQRSSYAAQQSIWGFLSGFNGLDFPK